MGAAVSAAQVVTLKTPPQRDGAIWVTEGGFKIQSTGYLEHPEDIPYQLCSDQKCDVTIFVEVDTKGDGHVCTFEGPYLVVLKHKNAKITWTLVEKNSKTNARFSTTNNGIYIYLGALTKAHFTGNKPINANQYYWERAKDINDGEDHGGYHGKHDQGALGYFYDIYVIHDYGVKQCAVPDPVIINRD